MRKICFGLAVLILLCGCSGDKSTGGRSPLPFEVSVGLLALNGIETAVAPVSGQLAIRNLTEDSVHVFVRNKRAWLALGEDRFHIEAGDSAVVQLSADLNQLAQGSYGDTIEFVDLGSSGIQLSIPVNLDVDADSFIVQMLHPTSNVYYAGYWDPYHCYTIVSGWYLKCRSLSGNRIPVVAYEAWSDGKLAELTFDHLYVNSGDSLLGDMQFDGCTTVPPPLDPFWSIKVGYRFKGGTLWAYLVY